MTLLQNVAGIFSALEYLCLDIQTKTIYRNANNSVNFIVK